MEEERYVKAKRAAEGEQERGWKPGGGQMLGLGLALILLVASIVLGLTTGVGLIFAVPLAVVAVGLGLMVLRGGARPRMISAACPKCGAGVSVPSHISETSCASCGARVELRGGRLQPGA